LCNLFNLFFYQFFITFVITLLKFLTRIAIVYYFAAIFVYTMTKTYWLKSASAFNVVFDKILTIFAYIVLIFFRLTTTPQLICCEKYITT